MDERSSKAIDSAVHKSRSVKSTSFSGEAASTLIEQETFIKPASHKIVAGSNSNHSWDAIASRLLSEKFLLTALELHGELVESGKELPRLTNFFSNPANFDLTAAPALPLLAASASLANICE